MRNKDIFFLSLLTFLTVVAWIGFDIYHAAVTSTISPILEKQIQPLTPKFDTEIVEVLKKNLVSP